MKRDGIFTCLAVMAGVVVFIGIKMWLHQMSVIVDPLEPQERVRLAALKAALEMYEVDNGHYPPTTNNLDFLALPPTSGPYHTPYLSQAPRDQWGNSYRYEYPGKHNTNTFDLSSAGPDGVFGTADDIGNWTATSGQK